MVKKSGFVLIIILILIDCIGNSIEDNAVKVAVRDIPDQETWDFNFVLTSEGKSQSKVKAGHMVKFNSKGIYELDESVVVDFYSKDGNHTSQIISDSGFVGENGSFMTAKGNVKAVSDSGIILLSEELKWDKDSKEIYTDKFVTIYSEGDTVHGYGFKSDQDLRRWEIIKPIGTSKRKITL